MKVRFSKIKTNGRAISFLPFVPTYDADGNATLIRTSTGTWTISYNAENRPVRFENAGTQTVVECAYDSQGRRTEYKSVTNGVQNTWLRFLYDGYLCIQVLYSNAPYNVFKEFVWDPTEPVATRPLVFRYAPNSLNLFYAFDGNKNVSDVFYRMNANGIGAHYDYAPFGATTRTHRDSSASFDIVTLNPFRFSSEYYDSELDLVYYNYRHYSPPLGRFLSRDPIAEQGGLNLYAFVGNAPTAKWDVLGKWSFWEWLKRCLGFKSTGDDIKNYSLAMGATYLGAECIRFRNKYMMECIGKDYTQYCKKLKRDWKTVCDMAKEAATIAQ